MNTSDTKNICQWLEENDDLGDINLIKSYKTGIALLYLNNPSKKNAITGKMISKFTNIINELEVWKEGKILIVYGSKNFFCSGLNLNLVKKIVDKKWHSTQMAIVMTNNFQRLKNLSMLTIALVEGKALGGGAEFATNLDIRIFCDKTQIGFVHKKMGISTAWGGGVSLTKLLGPVKALEILLSSKLIESEEAFNLGLANYTINSKKQFNLNKEVNLVNKTNIIINKNFSKKKFNGLNKIQLSTKLKKKLNPNTILNVQEKKRLKKKLRRILFDVNEKYLVNSEIKTENINQNSIKKNVISNYESIDIEINKEDDNTILIFVYNWFAKLTSIFHDWSDLKKIVKDQRGLETINLLTNFQKITDSNFMNEKTNWSIQQFINFMDNQT